MNRVIPSINGYASVMENIGKTESTGVDLTLSTVNIQNKNFFLVLRFLIVTQIGKK